MLFQSNPNGQRGTLILLLSFLLLDTGYSYMQHLHIPLDGDMAAIVLPAENYQKVLQDPFGLSVLQGDRHSAPNRFFVHWPMSAYFLHVPVWLQQFTSPVDSIYLACALAKVAIQLLLIALLAAFATASSKFRWQDWLLAAAVATPFFQTGGYNLQMGLVENSITYSFFYPLPLAMLGCFLYPFYRSEVRAEPLRLPIWQHILLLCLAVALPLSGPLVAAVVLLACPLVLVKIGYQIFAEQPDQPIFRRAAQTLRKLPKPLFFYFLLIGLVSLWSMYVGSFNIENPALATPLIDRYPALLKGIGSIFTQKLGLPLLAAAIVANLFLVSKYAPSDIRQKLFHIGKWLAVFILAYLLLLPLGGYRIYRPLIIRHDTVMPVTLCLVFFYGLTTFHLLRKIEWKWRRWYATGAVVFAAMFTAADLPEFGRSDCERAALHRISLSTEKVVKLDSDCPVMAWDKITDPHSAEINAKLLKLWGVTDDLRLYFSEPQ
ncbi:MAG: hypothetical protein K9J37_02305 [Saprospiraceae bacterium]|nr:hypothetical protein [Saprospiraceae bacterium]MCF8248712.1 hypothetical protein [Saprospiraceae bacterium]MCF8278798.1 hypothetical protein [Bacteroidales bacterium]MCF8310598.1 hypothetical protein [Saprospiraceae bacterium]MCF8439157.1 hypothetical protein [Saprospiraceae bacterium]